MKQIIIASCVSILSLAIGIDSNAQGKGNQKKEQANNKGNQDKGNPQKAQPKQNNPGKGQGQGQGQNNSQAGSKGQGNGKGKSNPNVFDDADGRGQGKGNGNGRGNGKDNGAGHAKNIGKGNDDVRKIVSAGGDYHYLWNRDNFDDRRKIKNAGKVTVCHKYGRGDERPVTINISRNALDAHLRHGDVQGNCPTYNGNRRLSDIIFGRRTNYYNLLYDTQDEVVYSQSILDYALQRLTGARSELVVLQNSNAPVYIVEERQAAVNELENNVSLLEVALAATAAILVSKLLF